MKEFFDWLKRSLSHLWEGLLKNLGTAIAAFILSGGYLVAINKLQEFQQAVRGIPTDYVLTPLVLLAVVAGALWNINRRQRRQLSQIQQQQPQMSDQASRFVTHFGVWWKLYPESEYIEDFPYCPCCEVRKKLVQIEWHPDEIFKCPATGTDVKLYDRIPRKLHDLLQNLYRTYFGGDRFEEELMREFHRLKELSPSEDEDALLRRVFTFEPFSRIPREEVNAILERFKNPHEVFFFLRRNYRSYRHFLRRGAGKA